MYNNHKNLLIDLEDGLINGLIVFPSFQAPKNIMLNWEFEPSTR